MAEPTFSLDELCHALLRGAFGEIDAGQAQGAVCALVPERVTISARLVSSRSRSSGERFRFARGGQREDKELEASLTLVPGFPWTMEIAPAEPRRG